eukprot:4005366-Amphidinium_carterae.1
MFNNSVTDFEWLQLPTSNRFEFDKYCFRRNGNCEKLVNLLVAILVSTVVASHFRTLTMPRRSRRARISDSLASGARHVNYGV